MRIALRHKDAAIALGISESTLRTLVSEGKIHAPYRIKPHVVLFDAGRLRSDWEALKAAATNEDTNEWDDLEGAS
jgi:predicted site-specific integrase-resolvase